MVHVGLLRIVHARARHKSLVFSPLELFVEIPTMPTALRLLTCCFLICQAITATALPVYGEQTGEKCASCHISMGELTPRGRKFKLLGYSEGEKKTPFAAVGTASVTQIKSTNSSAAPSVTMPSNGSFIPEMGSALVTGKFGEDVGGKIKWTANLANTSPLYGSDGVQTGTKVGKDLFLDASEVRVVKRDNFGGVDAIYGVSVNNAPTQQDLWNTTPVNSFPYRSSSLLNAWGMGQFGPTTLVDGGLTSQTIGMSVHGLFDDKWYVDIGNYWKMASGYSVLSVAGPQNTINSNANPYWRFARTQVDGASSWMVGTFGMTTTLARDPLVVGSAPGFYKDIGLDAQYQHITDSHTWSAQAVLIRESTDWGTNVGRSHDTSQTTLRTFKNKLSYDFVRTYAASVFHFHSWGSRDRYYWAYDRNPRVTTGACNQNNSMLAFCSQNGRPDTSGYGFEMSYSPLPQLTLTLQQTYYQTFLGGSQFIDNSSARVRAASDNNLTYLYGVYSY